MKPLFRIAVLALALAGLAGIAPVQAATTSSELASIVAEDELLGQLAADGQSHLVVNFGGLSGPAVSDDVDLEQLTAQVEALQNGFISSMADRSDITIRTRFQAIPALAVTVSSVDALNAIAAHPAVEAVHEDMGGTGSLGSSVPVIDADDRHAAGNEGDGVVVAVLDTGADLDHPDLVDDVLSDQACFGDNGGAGFCANGTTRQFGVGAGEDDAGHGTHVSGIVTSAGTVSSPGAAPGAELLSVKVLDNCSFSGCFYFFSEILAALDWIIANNSTLDVQVINMSLVTFASFAGDCDASFPAAATSVTTLRGLGVSVFAASGNSGGSSMGAPACLSPVIAVGATDNSDNVAFFTDSNAGTDVFAPGVSVVSLAIGGGTTTASGTSMASPHAAGCAALLIESGDAVSANDVETRLETSPVSVVDNGISFPRIDCGPDESTPTCNGQAVTVDIGAGDTPTAGDDVILGTDGPDVIAAGAGNDVVCAGKGADRVLGQGGNDIIFGENGSDVLAGNDGNDTIYGGGGDDSIFGGSGEDFLDGGLGNDLIGGSAGVDTVLGNDGNDTITGGSGGDAEVNGGAGEDAVNGGSGNDTNVTGGNDDDTVSGNGGNDTINGGDGNDEVRGGPGNDTVNGNGGDDFLAGNDGTDTCNGGGGTDTAASNCETILNVP